MQKPKFIGNNSGCSTTSKHCHRLDTMPTHISIVTDYTWGGAATSARRLFDAFRSMGRPTVRWYAAEGDVSAPAMITGTGLGCSRRQLPLRLAAAARPPLASRPEFRRKILSMELAATLTADDPAVINLHNIHMNVRGALLPLLPELPIVWTLHDMWALTGYCCYSGGCDKYRSGCVGHCPEAGRWGMGDRAPEEEWLLRNRWFKQHRERLALVAPSRWLAACARERFGDMLRIEHIPYGLDTSVFAPHNEKRAIRIALGLKPDKPTVLLFTSILSDTRKGHGLLGPLAAALHSMIPPPQVIAVGKVPDPSMVPAGWHCPGAVSDEALLNLYYNAADVHVLPTFQDNLPNTLLEAISAGTPCVTFDVGGCGDIVRDGISGVLVSQQSAAGLAAGVEHILGLSQEHREGLSQGCRRIALDEYNLLLQGRRYAKLYEEMIEAGRNVQRTNGET